MGILQSVLKYWSSEPDEDENVISSYNNPHHKWQGGNTSIVSPDLKSLLHTNVKSSTLLIKQNTPQNVNLQSGKQRGDAAVTVKCNVMSAEGRWMKHYSSCHRILLVGDGDFSFSTCLAAAFGWASNMIATSLDSQAFLVKNYHNALPNLVELGIRKCKVMHEIDATKMSNHPYLEGIKFDRIVFNFPFAGFFKDISRDSQLQRHRSLVSKFLMNAKEMISENGEIHITHKTNGFHMEWKVELIASSHRLRLVEAVDFNHLEYPGYNTKCGFGTDNNFNCYPSKTYKFRL
ncbi:hypothetical protein ACS0TY_033266 [Phlomoides rotata]